VNLICNICKCEKLITDFINSENICYKCIYREKLEKSTGKRTEKVLNCRACGNEIILKKNAKKRQRTVFCSYECAEKGHKHQLNNHWTRKVSQNGETINGKPIINRSYA
jgi:hypothetical protein